MEKSKGTRYSKELKMELSSWFWRISRASSKYAGILEFHEMQWIDGLLSKETVIMIKKVWLC